MRDFLLKELYDTDIKKELDDIGFDSSYAPVAASKFIYKNFKIFNLTVAQANILKQTALSTGADCATHHDVITGKKEISSCIIGGSLSQLALIAKKIKKQPFGLKELAALLEEKITVQTPPKTKIIGILNLTTNSFSDGGMYYDFESAAVHLQQLISDGADIIDIGAESTRPGAKPVNSDDQLNKLAPVLRYIKEKNITAPVSIDTRSAEVAKRCIELGAQIINDVSGFDFDRNMVDVVAKTGVKVIIQHSLGTPDKMQNSPVYQNLMDDIYRSLKQKVDFALSKGVKKENIIIDPGIGFGKTRENNLEIIKRWKELKTIGCPVLIGLSRKSFLNMPDASNEEKDTYTLAFDSLLMNENIDYIRVHNVKIHKKLQNAMSF